MDEQTEEKTQNILVDHLFQCRISLWPKTAEKYVFLHKRYGRTDRPMDGPTDGPTDQQMDRLTDRPSYRDAFLRTHLKM